MAAVELSAVVSVGSSVDGSDAERKVSVWISEGRNSGFSSCMNAEPPMMQAVQTAVSVQA